MISNLIKIFFQEHDTPTTFERHTPTYPYKFQSKYINFMGIGICIGRWNLIPSYTLNRTYRGNFVSDAMGVTRMIAIPLKASYSYVVKLSDLVSLKIKSNVNYSVKISRVLPQPDVVFIYIVVTCGGHRMSNHLSHLGLCNSPHDIERNYYGYTS